MFTSKNRQTSNIQNPHIVNEAKSQSFKIAIIYSIIGCLWIILSDLLVQQDHTSILFFSILKGILYVIVSAFLIFGLVYSNLKKVLSVQNSIKKINVDLQNERDRAQMYLDIMRVIFITLDDAMKVTLINREGCELLGLPKEEIIGKNWIDHFVHEKHKQEILQVSKELLSGRIEGNEIRENLINAAAGPRLISWRNTLLKNDSGQITGILSSGIDITESKAHFDQIQYMNDHDFLTGLYNRRYFEKQKRNLDTQDNLPIAIILADINGVRLINDAFGHMAGDKLIKKTAEILQVHCPENSVLAKTGGDEFSFLLTNTNRDEIKEVILSINNACREYNETADENTSVINLSIGYGIKQSADQSIKDADKEAEDNMFKRKLLYRESHHNAIITSVMATMYERSEETEEHARRIANLSMTIGEAMNLPQKSLDDLQLLAMLHDIGKIGIDDRILKKPGNLTKDEWDEMKKHPEIGYRIAMASKELEPVAQYILHHHERWDGTGYPGGFSGEEIPLLSRILAVVDSYDAMTENRVYRKALTREEAIIEIAKNAGTQFDPKIVDLFIKYI